MDRDWRRRRIHTALVIAAANLATAGTFYALSGLRSAMLALLGVFLGTYFQDRPRAARLRSLPLVGAGLVLCSCVGVAGSGQLVAAVACIVATAILATWLTLAASTGPPGALMFVVTCGVSAYAAGRLPPGSPPSGAWSIPLLVLAGCAITYALVALSLPWPRAADAGAFATPPQRREHWRLDANRRLILARVALGSVVAGLAGLMLNIGRTYWIVQTVVAVLQMSPAWHATSRRALHRVAGTLLGIALFYAFVSLRLPPLPLIVLLATLQFATEVVIVRHYGLGLLLITPAALLISEAAGGQPWQALAGERLADTLAGSAIALAAGWLVDRIAGTAGDARDDGPGNAGGS